MIVAGTDIIVSLATDANGAVISTAAQVAAAINASPAAAALVVAQTVPGSPGSGIVQPYPLSSLVPVRFTISSGAITSIDTCWTNIPGVCSISYSSSTVRNDQISAYVDVNGNGTRQPDEPLAGALTTWFDGTAPVLTLPANITTPATSAGGAVVSFTASASDNIDGPVPVTCSPASGSSFPVGVTAVSCSASDAGGNLQSGSFTVTVTPFVAPFVQLVTSAVFTRNATGQWVASLTVRNAGNAIADNVRLTTALLNTTAAVSLPVSFGPIPPGGTATQSVTFPGTAGNSGPANVLRMTLTWTGGSVSVSQRAALP